MNVDPLTESSTSKTPKQNVFVPTAFSSIPHSRKMADTAVKSASIKNNEQEEKNSGTSSDDNCSVAVLYTTKPEVDAISHVNLTMRRNCY
ncbi:hypothetical protein MBANPS3_004875 [Mucor bainieri]